MMKEYTTLTELKQAFVTGEFQLDGKVKVDTTEYSFCDKATGDMLRSLTENAKTVFVYESTENSNWLLFLWGAHKNAVVPYDVRTTTRPILEAQDVSDRIIPDKVEVHFLNLPVGGSLVAKVDTGAEMNSLNAKNVQVNRGQGTVTFVAPQLSHSTITTQLADQQAVKTSGGDTTYRAVIKATLKIKGKVLKDQLVNLNDRSEMQDPMLLGQNALQAGKFLIDPNIIKEASDLITPEFLATLRQDTVVPPTHISKETKQKLYEAFDEVGNISIGDMMKLLRTQVLKNIDDISY